MCELLGLCFNLPVRPDISFRGFRHRGENNPDGWGIAFFPDESAQIIKEEISAKQSKLSKFLLDYLEIEAPIFIGHVRRASTGGISRKNTHPFNRELNGTEYVFAHNGKLNHENLELGRFKPIGETDSETAFCYLLHRIENAPTDILKSMNKNKYFDWLAERLEEINKYGSLNCIFSDGKYLLCYHDKDGYNGLCFVQRRSPYGKVKLVDEDWEVNLAEEKSPDQEGYIVATKRLTKAEHWEDFEPGELIVFTEGKIAYSNKRDINV